MITTTQLPALLRGCIQWRDNRPWVDNDALLIVADWCEENDQVCEAETIRDAMRWDEQAATWEDINPHESNMLTYDLMRPVNGNADQVTMDLHGGILLDRNMRVHDTEGQGRVYWLGEISVYCTDPNEDRPERLTYRNLPNHPGPLRVRDLCRWDLICRMLGYPPMRILCED